MRKIVLFTLLVCLFVSVNAQLTVTTGALTPTQYVQNVLIGGGVTVSNVTFTGNPNQVGEFDGTNTTIGIGPGLILGSGDVNGAIGPNNNGSMSLPNGGYGGAGDPDVFDIINAGGGTTVSEDAAVLEFDFIPTGDTVKFNYVFGSEEYPQFAPPQSAFGTNDAFGFFLSGPGITGAYTSPAAFPGGAKNIALIPGTSTAVTILNINPVTNSGYYIDNGDGFTAPFNTNNQNVQYNGITTVMTAISEVQCGLTYHIKIAISDASDGSWDSGVFLQAGSFSSNNVILNSSVDVGGSDSVLYEGCGTALLDFVRTETLNSAVYHYTIAGGTASGSDYIINADSVVFLPGEDTVTLSFNAIQDGIAEPLESVTIQLVQTVCSVIDTQQITFYISDFPEPILTMHDTIKPCGSNDSVPVWVNVLGPEYTVSWNTVPIQTTDTIWVNPIATEQYVVTVSDTCGVYTVYDTAEVVVPLGAINLTSSNDSTKYCLQDNIEIFVTPLVGGGNYTYLWNNGGVTDSSMIVNPVVTTDYIVEVTDACGTIEFDTITITVPNFVPLTANVLNNDDTICVNDVVTIDGLVAGGVDAYYSWDNGLGSVTPVNVAPAITTTYILTAMDSCGAIAKDSVTIYVPNFLPVVVAVNPDVAIACPGDPVELIATVSGGSGNATTIYWSDGTSTFTGNNIIVTPLTDITYTAWIIDTCAQDSGSSGSFNVTLPNYSPIVLDVFSEDTLICIGDGARLEVASSGGSGLHSYLWSNGSTSQFIQVAPKINSTYLLSVTDGCGITKDTSVTVALSATNANYTYEYEADNAIQFTTAGAGVTDYLWIFDNGISTDQNPLHTFDFDGVHEVSLVVINAFGCTDSTFQTIDPQQFIYVPNSFTPNGDGLNDEFMVKGAGIKSFKLSVFDRWGVLLFETDNVTNAWNGTYRSKELPNGIYVYKLEAESYENIIFKKTSKLTIIR